MKPFTEIEAFRHIVASVKRYCAERSKPLPTIEYVGTVKLHGTNAGVRVTSEFVQPQKRSDIVSALVQTMLDLQHSAMARMHSFGILPDIVIAQISLFMESGVVVQFRRELL